MKWVWHANQSGHPGKHLCAFYNILTSLTPFLRTSFVRVLGPLTLDPVSDGPQLLLYTSIMSFAWERATASSMSVLPLASNSLKPRKKSPNLSSGELLKYCRADHHSSLLPRLHSCATPTPQIPLSFTAATIPPHLVPCLV